MEVQELEINAERSISLKLSDINNAPEEQGEINTISSRAGQSKVKFKDKQKF